MLQTLWKQDKASGVPTTSLFSWESKVELNTNEMKRDYFKCDGKRTYTQTPIKTFEAQV